MGRLVGVYVRISRDDVGEQTSTARQERLCCRYAAEQGWEVVEVFADVDRSAYLPGVVREGYERLLAAASGRRVDAVLVWRLDRLVRSPAEFERLWATSVKPVGRTAWASERRSVAVKVIEPSWAITSRRPDRTTQTGPARGPRARGRPPTPGPGGRPAAPARSGAGSASSSGCKQDTSLWNVRRLSSSRPSAREGTSPNRHPLKGT